MNSKLKLILRDRSREQGFALPVAVGLGLVMILIGTTMVVRSQGDRVTASAQRATATSLSAAEIGLSRYQSLITNNRAIAMYPRVGTPGWTTATNIPNFSSACATTVGGPALVVASASTDWQNISPTQASQGQYRLVDYTYPTPGVTGSTGRLTVEGRVNQVGSGASATQTAGTATTRLSINLPVVEQPINRPIPGLWMTDNTSATRLGGNKVSGNILVTGCENNTQITDANIVAGTGSVVANRDIPFPDTPSLPPANVLNSGNLWGATLPRPGDIKNPTDGKYHYLVPEISLSGGSGTTKVAAGEQAIIYVQGNISSNGGPSVNSPGYPHSLQIYGNTYTNAAKTQTKYGCATGQVLGTSCPTLSVSISGSGNYSALVHAPDASGSVNGGGGSCNTTVDPPSGPFVGAVWLKTYASSSNTSNTVICAYGNFSNFNATQGIVRPAIPSVTAWERQEVQP